MCFLGFSPVGLPAHWLEKSKLWCATTSLNLETLTQSRLRELLWGKSLLQPGLTHLKEFEKLITSHPGYHPSHSTSDTLTTLTPSGHLLRTPAQPTPIDYGKTSNPKSTQDALPGNSVNKASPSNSWTWRSQSCPTVGSRHPSTRNQWHYISSSRPTP